MDAKQERPHVFTIGDGYGIWTDGGETHRHFPEEFLRARPGDAAGEYRIGDFVEMYQPFTKTRFGMFVVANVETGDYGGAGLKYRITVRPYGTPGTLDGKARAARQADGGRGAAVRRPTYRMERVRIADCRPHADAEAYSASGSDRAALSNSVGEAGILSPIAVVPDGDGGGWLVIDGIGRLDALRAAGAAETDAQVFDLGDLSVAEFVVSKNAMTRKVTTGSRVMAYLRCHEREVLEAAAPGRYKKRPGNGANFKGRHHAVSHETARYKGWNAKEIAERIGVSKNDVLAGIELLKASAETPEGGTYIDEAAEYARLDLFETMEAVLRGETPIRRWRAAAGGRVSKTGGRAAADYAAIAWRTVKSWRGVWENWQTVPMEARAGILREFRAALESLPEDFQAVIGDALGCGRDKARPSRGGAR